VLDTLFHALIRYAAPVMVFTAEEVWQSRCPDGGSVHLLEWPDLSRFRHPGPRAGLPLDSGAALEASGTPDQVRGDEFMDRWTQVRVLREKVTEAIEPLRRDKAVRSSLEAEVSVPGSMVPAGFSDADLAELFISAAVTRGPAIAVRKTDDSKCGRCWRLLPEVPEDGALCHRCEDAVAQLDAVS
jgi:isoleucyl-tRNA synthetase